MIDTTRMRCYNQHRKLLIFYVLPIFTGENEVRHPHERLTMTRFTLLIAAVSLFPNVGYAAPIAQVEVIGVVNLETNESYPGQSDASVIVETPSLVSLPFGSLEDVDLSFIWTAPAGKQINVDAPIDFPFAQLDARFIFGNSYTGLDSFQDDEPIITFEGLIGTAPTLDFSVIQFSGPSGNQVVARALFNLTPGESFSFQKIILSTMVPGEFDVDFSGTPATGAGWGIVGSAFELSLSEPESITEADPQWVYLSDVSGPAVPEPSTIALLLTGGVGLIGYGWRRKKNLAV
ncbi:MAG: PEP-CTERM sorting domain-containing protein [Planctomycetota bacterium]|nr:PEP-CTERM sorting domain-containing protein [Planctomycetota bacterium]